MSVRNDVTVDFDSSPRIITVQSPSVEINMQDLVDTCRYIEALSTSMDNPHLVAAAGKEALGGNVYVGITVILQNAKLAFEARGGPTFVQCNVSGGNLVAVDENGADIDPIQTTAYVQVVRTSSSSATLQELLDIQYSSFGGGITLDESSSYSGTVYPVGTPRQPVNNLTDAMSIATLRGFNTIFILGDATIDSSGDYNGMIFIGESITKSLITIDEASNVEDCEFYEMEVSGYLDGNARLKNCLIKDLNYVYGVVELCMLEAGTIVLSGSNPAYFLDCWCGSTTTLPIIDMGGSGQDLAIRGYSGGIKLKNKSGSDTACITLAEGQLELDSTITNGVVQVIGVGQLIDNSNGATVDATHLLRKESIQSYIWDATAASFAITGSMGDMITHALIKNADMSGDILRIYRDAGMTQVWKRFDLSSGGRVEVL